MSKSLLGYSTQEMNNDAYIASVHWWRENKERGANYLIPKLLPLLFDTIDALYFVTRSLPLHAVPGATTKEITSDSTLTIGALHDAKDHVTLRATLSLMGDIYYVAHALLENKGLLELEKLIKELYDVASKSRHARDFFTHIDQMVTNMEGNGISGPIISKSGLIYSESAKSCVHLIWKNNSLYFTKDKREWKTPFRREDFDPIFEKSKKIYEVITSHNPPRPDYRLAEGLYPETENK